MKLSILEQIIEFEQFVIEQLGKPTQEIKIHLKRTLIKYDLLDPDIMDFTHALHPYYEFYIYPN